MLAGDSAFENFMRFADWMFDTVGRTHAIALNELARFVMDHLVQQRDRPPAGRGQFVAGFAGPAAAIARHSWRYISDDEADGSPF